MERAKDEANHQEEEHLTRGPPSYVQSLQAYKPTYTVPIISVFRAFLIRSYPPGRGTNSDQESIVQRARSMFSKFLIWDSFEVKVDNDYGEHVSHHCRTISKSALDSHAETAEHVFQLTVPSQVTSHTHPRSTCKWPKILLLGPRTSLVDGLVDQKPLRLPKIRCHPLLRISMQHPLESIDTHAWRDAINASDGHGVISRCDSWERRAIWTHAKRFLQNGTHVGEMIKQYGIRKLRDCTAGDDIPGFGRSDGEQLFTETSLTIRTTGDVVDRVPKD